MKVKLILALALVGVLLALAASAVLAGPPDEVCANLEKLPGIPDGVLAQICPTLTN